MLGGGASGLLAACALSASGLHVTVLEKQAKVGRKLLATGNGRCNLTNLNMGPDHYFGDVTGAAAVLSRFPPERIRGAFRELGLETVADGEGRVYPRSNQAASVLDALRLAIPLRGGEIVTEASVAALKPHRGGFRIDCEDGRRFAADLVLCAMGGQASGRLGGCDDGVRLLKDLGHRAADCFPALSALKTEPKRVRPLKGQRLRCEVSLYCDGEELQRETGEVIFGDDQISGIAAMQLARAAQQALRAGRRPEVRLNAWGEGPEAALEMLRNRTKRLSDYPVEDFLSGLIPRRIGMEMAKWASVPLGTPAGSLNAAQLKALAAALSAWRFPVLGAAGFADAQVTAGGISLSEFDPTTLESRRVPRLFAAGEVLNLDGECGGYNLHWAWASALAVAEGMLHYGGR